jgi:hypothetical protein
MGFSILKRFFGALAFGLCVAILLWWGDLLFGWTVARVTAIISIVTLVLLVVQFFLMEGGTAPAPATPAAAGAGPAAPAATAAPMSKSGARFIYALLAIALGVGALYILAQQTASNYPQAAKAASDRRARNDSALALFIQPTDGPLKFVQHQQRMLAAQIVARKTMVEMKDCPDTLGNPSSKAEDKKKCEDALDNAEAALREIDRIYLRHGEDDPEGKVKDNPLTLRGLNPNIPDLSQARESVKETASDIWSRIHSFQEEPRFMIILGIVAIVFFLFMAIFTDRKKNATIAFRLIAACVGIFLVASYGGCTTRNKIIDDQRRQAKARAHSSGGEVFGVDFRVLDQNHRSVNIQRKIKSEATLTVTAYKAEVKDGASCQKVTGCGEPSDVYEFDGRPLGLIIYAAGQPFVVTSNPMPLGPWFVGKALELGPNMPTNGPQMTGGVSFKIE